MRTTVDIPDRLYRRLKTRAAREGRSAKALILEGVEQVLDAKATGAGRRVVLPIVPSRRPGIMRIDNARIYDVISFP
jgi:plasmid stability protein